MQILTCARQILHQHVARVHKDHRFMVAISTIVPDQVALYGCNSAAVDALIEARTDYPRGEVVGEFEYLSPATLAAIRSGKYDPMQSTLDNLGRVKD